MSRAEDALTDERTAAGASMYVLTGVCTGPVLRPGQVCTGPIEHRYGTFEVKDDGSNASFTGRFSHSFIASEGVHVHVTLMTGGTWLLADVRNETFTAPLVDLPVGTFEVGVFPLGTTYGSGASRLDWDVTYTVAVPAAPS